MYARVGKIALSHRIRINAWKEQADTVKKNKGTLSLLRELKATRTLAVVVGAFVVCWLGYFVVLLRTTVCWWKPSLNCQPAPHEVVISVLWIKYFNSSLNPFIYAIMNGDMRKALKRFLRGKLIPSETSFEMRWFIVIKKQNKEPVSDDLSFAKTWSNLIASMVSPILSKTKCHVINFSCFMKIDGLYIRNIKFFEQHLN